MKLGLQRKEISTRSVVDVLQVLCQTVKWRCLKVGEHEDIIEHPYHAFWSSWVETNDSSATKNFERYVEQLQRAWDPDKIYSCLNSFYRMTQHAASGGVGAAMDPETIQDESEEISAVDSTSEGNEPERSAVLRSVSLQSPEVYRSAAKQAMTWERMPWDCLNGMRSISNVEIDPAFPLRRSFGEGPFLQSARYHHLDMLYTVPGSTQLLHWDENRSVKPPVSNLRHIVDVGTGKKVDLKGCISSRENPLLDLAAAVATASAKISANGGLPPKCSDLPTVDVPQSLQLKVDDKWTPLADLLDRQELSWLTVLHRLGHGLPHRPLRLLMISSRDIKPGTFIEITEESEEPDFDEEMPKRMFDYSQKVLVKSKIPEFWTYAVTYPNQKHQDTSPYNCMVASLNTESGETLNVGAYKPEGIYLYIFFPRRQYVFKMVHTGTLCGPHEVEDLKQLMVYLEKQCPAERRSEPWVQVQISFADAKVEHCIRVEDEHFECTDKKQHAAPVSSAAPT